jgi:predicted nucleic acid-binding protein
MEVIADTSIIIALLISEKEQQHILQAIENYELVCVASVEAEIGNAVSAMFRRGRISLQ